jgi:dTDP-4-dehydrorhamnose reductase
MRVLVLGARGALGKATEQAFLDAGHDALGLERGDCDITNEDDLVFTLRHEQPDLVVNCAGLIPERGAGEARMAIVNAYGPLLLASLCAHHGVRLVHISTDCVFRPDAKRWHFIEDRPDAADSYGRSKALGEMGQGMTAVRTSFVTPEHGLWRWLASQPDDGEVAGWMGAIWSGSTVWAVADGLVRIAEAPEHNAVEHLATPQPISKHEALVLLKRRLGLKVAIRGEWGPKIMRGLYPTVHLEPFESAIAKAPILALDAGRAG